jgi:diguanylate cyclase (GGDEF)-like protein
MLDVTSTDVNDGERDLFAVYGRAADDRRATDEVVMRLLRGATRRELLHPVCDLFAWQQNGTHIGISWWEPDEGWTYVSTGLPSTLVGADRPAGAPWQTSRDRLVELDDSTHLLLDNERRAKAAALGLTSCWIVPVPDVGGRPPALITVWGGSDQRRPGQVHAYGMSVARTFVELILRWSHQVQRLDSAAHSDDLTGLANRKAFFDRLDEVTGSGALLYCDLDSFKPVNDAWGHTAGDALLRQAADRLRISVRSDDLVARLGGDEFAILCPGATVGQAGELAERIRAAFRPPFTLGIRQVEIGISIGIGHAPIRLSVDTLESADQDLYRAKTRNSF